MLVRRLAKLHDLVKTAPTGTRGQSIVRDEVLMLRRFPVVALVARRMEGKRLRLDELTADNGLSSGAHGGMTPREYFT